jgi:hypothetical protein
LIHHRPTSFLISATCVGAKSQPYAGLA